MITGTPLFAIDTWGDLDETNDDHLLHFHDILGPVPPDILAVWPRSHIYFDEMGNNIKLYIGNLRAGFDVSTLEPFTPLEEFFDKEKPAEMSEEETVDVKRILRWILQYDAAQRPSASDLLKDSWFAGSETVVSRSGEDPLYQVRSRVLLAMMFCVAVLVEVMHHTSMGTGS